MVGTAIVAKDVDLICNGKQCMSVCVCVCALMPITNPTSIDTNDKHVHTHTHARTQNKIETRLEIKLDKHLHTDGRPCSSYLKWVYIFLGYSKVCGKKVSRKMANAALGGTRTI